ncbi:uncharacterized protein LOC132623035 [Lycium barbarum]|uniref:uncharacterized protein LOC132623035 n=1 Tax=Lycium barbarum TaxID=112863 RepID=UPI00293E5819|nr:uncharacterized protein LOC132623035 [Lycium barbarum]
MASSVVCFPAIIIPSSKYRVRQKLPQIRAQSYRDEGKSGHVVDSNLQVLSSRIEEVKMKERLEKCLVCEQGWNYTATTASLYLQKKRKKQLDQCVELLLTAGGTIGFTVLGCTLCLYLTSFLIHYH